LLDKTNKPLYEVEVDKELNRVKGSYVIIKANLVYDAVRCS
jgi:hypothetical protein